MIDLVVLQRLVAGHEMMFVILLLLTYLMSDQSNIKVDWAIDPVIVYKPDKPDTAKQVI